MKASGIGNFDSQMSLQLYGQTSSSTLPTQSKKSHKRIPSYVKDVPQAALSKKTEVSKPFDLIQKRIKEQQEKQNEIYQQQQPEPYGEEEEYYTEDLGPELEQ